MNHVTLIGRLTRDPDIRYTANHIPYATFTLAVDRRFAKKDENSNRPTADFIRVVAWNKTAELCGNYLAKGRKVAIGGRIATGSYDAKDGSKRYTTDVVVEQLEFLDSGKGNGQRNTYAASRASDDPAPAYPEQGALPDDASDEEIPF